MTRILIIEDDKTFANQVAGLLSQNGFCIEQCHDGEQGLIKALAECFDLILLDVLLPTLNGFSILTQIRSVKQTPIIMMTACGAEAERIEGYQKGADDYLPKPCNFTEMLLRIDALLRRSIGVQERNDQRELSIDALVLNRSVLSVHYNGQSIELTPIQFRLLWLLVEHQNDVLSKPFLYQMVLERPYSRYDRSMDMHLSRIRKKLVSAGMAADRLVTQHGKGYCFS
jgi:two-component system response regulator PfeR